MDASTSHPRHARLVPASGGRVPVRVRGFVEDAAPRPTGGLDRGFPVVLARTEHDVVKVVHGTTVLGYLPPAWSQVVDFELWSCEQACEAAVARALVEGRPRSRDLFVMLDWPRRRD